MKQNDRHNIYQLFFIQINDFNKLTGIRSELFCIETNEFNKTKQKQNGKRSMQNEDLQIILYPNR